LQNEFDEIWEFQQKSHPKTLTKTHYQNLKSQNRKSTLDYFEKTMELNRAEFKGKKEEKKLQELELRSKAISEKIELSEIAYILTEVNNEINQASGYLGEISDRSKKLFFKDWTVGQYQWNQLKKDSHTSLKNEVFYRQDYINEFNVIWDEQAKHYPELTDELKEKIRDRIIFYQRRLKSQKGLIAYCEFESWEQDVFINGKKKRKI